MSTNDRIEKLEEAMAPKSPGNLVAHLEQSRTAPPTPPTQTRAALQRIREDDSLSQLTRRIAQGRLQVDDTVEGHAERQRIVADPDADPKLLALVRMRLWLDPEPDLA